LVNPNHSDARKLIVSPPEKIDWDKRGFSANCRAVFAKEKRQHALSYGGLSIDKSILRGQAQS